MLVNKSLDVRRPVFLPDPVNRNHPLNRGRVSWWLGLPGLDGGRTWYDLVGRAHLTLSNMTTSASGWRGTTRTGGFGAVRLDGVDDYADAATVANIPGAGQAITVAAWFTPAATGITGVVVGRWDDGAAGHAWLLYQIPSDQVRWLGHDGVTTGYFTDAPAFTVGTPYRLLAAVNPSSYSSTTLYVNGLPVAPTSTTPAVVGSPGLTVGSSRNDATRAANGNGTVGDVSIWNRTLSPAEIAADYDLSRRGYPGVLNRY